jgi:hypothetical protein
MGNGNTCWSWQQVLMPKGNEGEKVKDINRGEEERIRNKIKIKRWSTERKKSCGRNRSFIGELNE